MRENNKGITLIALVITIIVMLILVGVTISMAVNGGLFEYAGRAVKETNEALKAEGQLAEGGVEVGGVWYNSIDEYLIATGNKTAPVETISKTETYVGCYADVDGDGTVDGVIYADLAVGNTGDGEWGDSDGVYTIPKETDLTALKDYYISGTANGAFGNGVKVLTATGEGKDRFYVMALEDVGSYTWYESKYESGTDFGTSGDFGTGKANTKTMIGLWNADTDEAKNSNDVWGVIQNSEDYEIVKTEADYNVSGKWFLPSKAEWSAFAEELGISNDSESEKYYGNYGLSGWYWSSSQGEDGTNTAWYADFNNGYMDYISIDGNISVRLSATF